MSAVKATASQKIQVLQREKKKMAYANMSK